MLAQEIIRMKRDGAALPDGLISEFVSGITDGSVTDAQISALAMAVFFNGMSRDETVALTLAMRDSGEVLDWSHLDQPVVDKHSTGGVGDNVSLMLAPIVAACGVAVPMISGRGLGHTGGTLDKMDSIPGYVSQPDNALFRKVTAEVGCAIIGQTTNLAPADKRFYGVRDVTATVENLSLITASILSKKLAAGLGWLVLDVKCGNGAFMDDIDAARALAESLVSVANGAGTKTTARITDMNETLASSIGNAVEVQNAVDFLTGQHRGPRLETVVLALAAEMIATCGAQPDLDAGMSAATAALQSGAAAEKFAEMVTALGGPSDFVERARNHLPKAPITKAVTAPETGHLTSMDARKLGVAVVELGGGRRRREDAVDPAVGLTEFVATGTALSKGDPVCVIHARNDDQIARAEAAVLDAITMGDTVAKITSPLIERIG
ncbi:MAG: thymidine phosphorylase [Pseudomonadota bacterium]